MSQWFFGVLAALLISAFPVSAQPSSFHGPIAGYVYSRAAKAIRPLLGIPGSSYLGSPVLEDVLAASISPGGEWAFVVSKDRRSSFVHGWTDTPLAAAAGGLLDAVDRVAWSRNGRFALLHSSSGSRLQRVRLSQNGAFADEPVDLPAESRIASMAIDPDGRQIAVGVTGSGVYLFDAGQSPALIAAMLQPAAATFADHGRLYVADVGTQRILEFHTGSGPVEFASLADPDSPAVNPVGLAVSGNGRYLMVVDAAASAVRVYEIGSRTLTKTVRLDFAPSRVELLSPDPVFLLTGESDSQLLLLDATQDLRIYFVPAGREAIL